MIRALLISLFSAATLAACATSPSHPSSRIASAVPPADCSTAYGEATRLDRSGCYSPIRVFSAEQMRSTGKTNVGQALQMLDPSITVHGH